MSNYTDAFHLHSQTPPLVSQVGRTIYYSFPGALPGTIDTNNNFSYAPQTYAALSQTLKDAVIDALEVISSYINVAFVPVTDPQTQQADITFGLLDLGTTRNGFCRAEGDADSADTAYIFFNKNPDILPGFVNNTSPGGSFFAAVLHEVGHALGLIHAEPHDASDTDQLPNSAERNEQFSIMSYNPHPDYAGSGLRPETLQLYDVAALQQLYGAVGPTPESDDDESTTYKLGGERAVLTIWDPSGDHDKIDATNQLGTIPNDQRAIIDLRQGEFSSIGFSSSFDEAHNNIAIAFNTVIEEAVGSTKDDILIGNLANNKLEGNGGNDWILGDGFVIADANEIYIDGESPFNDILGSVQKPEVQEFYNGAYRDSGSGKDTLIGGLGSDWLWGGEGDDVLNATGDQIDPEMGGFTFDVLLGGSGGDTFLCDYYDYIVDPDPSDVLWLGGTKVTGGAWQYLGEELLDMTETRRLRIPITVTLGQMERSTETVGMGGSLSSSLTRVAANTSTTG